MFTHVISLVSLPQLSALVTRIDSFSSRKRPNLIYVTSIMIITFLMFFSEYIINCYFSFCRFSVYIIFSCRIGMLLSYQITWRQMNVMYWTKQCLVYNQRDCNTSIDNCEYHARKRFDREPSRMRGQDIRLKKKLEKLSCKTKK